MTKILYERQDYLAAELALYKALSCRQSEKTAILLSLYHASIEHVKADYNKALKRIEEIENLESDLDIQLAPFTRFLINNQKAMVSIDQGNSDTAEKLLKENIKQYKNLKESYTMLYQMYIGQNMWEKASSLEQIITEQFPFFTAMNTAQIKNRFNSLPAKEKISFYIQYKNYRKAIDIIKTFSPLSLNNKILHAKLFYWEGNEDEAKNIIEDIFSAYSKDFRVINKIGDFYLKDLIRVKEALFYYKKSLEINKNQPEVSTLVSHLIENYLNKLKEF
jgi:tetratricopeptide (TPR) repeat protein